MTAHCYYKIGGIKEVEGIKEPSENKVDKSIKKWLDQKSTAKPKNVKRKKEKESKFMPHNMSH